MSSKCSLYLGRRAISIVIRFANRLSCSFSSLPNARKALGFGQSKSLRDLVNMLVALARDVLECLVHDSVLEFNEATHNINGRDNSVIVMPPQRSRHHSLVEIFASIGNITKELLLQLISI